MIAGKPKTILRRMPTSLRSLLYSRLAFCLAAALLMVFVRLLIFDYSVFFNLQAVPNHDMYEGASYFATSMHSIRLSGELAWWNPITHNGYAQYYQSFFSPLPPTSHHIVFILWATMIRGLSRLGIHIAEYRQYLIVTYVVFPFLAFSAFAYFASLLFRHRVTAFLMLLVYVFSGIGLWNSAWFYFQEPFSFFLLLAAALAALKKPTPQRVLVLLGAALIQLTSANYWTVFNLWFLLILAAAYGWIHPNQVRRLCVRTLNWVKQHQVLASAIIVLWVLTLASWMLIMGSIAREQEGNYVGQNEPYTATDAQGRVREIRRFTTELFNPNIQRAVTSYPTRNDMHSARYLGAFLLPLLVLVPAFRWRRRERWLMLSAAGVLVVCVAPPFLLAVWDKFPGMNRIRHTFDFYTQNWELLIVLIAGVGLEILLTPALREETKRISLALVSGLAILALTVLAFFLAFSHKFGLDDPNLEANLHVALLVLVVSIVVFQFLRFPTIRNRRLFILILLLLAATDLTSYFWKVNQRDRIFTAERFHTPVSLPSEIQQHLRQAWPAPDLQQGFDAGRSGNLPVANDVWPYNAYLRHRDLRQLFTMREEFYKFELEGPPLDFFATADYVPEPKLSTVNAINPDVYVSRRVLFLQSAPTSQLSAFDAQPTGFTYQFQKSEYNAFDFAATAPQPGWLVIRQLNDPRWKVILDGQRVSPLQANLVSMALFVNAGRHVIHMEYEPFARRLYWTASLLLIITLIALMMGKHASGLLPRRARGTRT